MLIPVSVARRDYVYFYSPLDGMLVHRRITLQHSCTCIERDTVRVQCYAQKQNAISAKARTPAAQFGDERTTTRPPHLRTSKVSEELSNKK